MVRYRRPRAARVFQSNDRGHTWTVSTTPVRNDGPAAGIFSLAFADARHGIAVGGDYSKDKEDRQNIAITNDGGATWTAPQGAGPKGFRSDVAWLPGRKLWIVTGTSGSDSRVTVAGRGSLRRWRLQCHELRPGRGGWAVISQGRIARFQPRQLVHGRDSVVLQTRSLTLRL